MWNVTSDRYDWDALQGSIKAHGVRNSLMVAPMPTASTSQILEITNALNHIPAIFIYDALLQENLLLSINI